MQAEQEARCGALLSRQINLDGARPHKRGSAAPACTSEGPAGNQVRGSVAPAASPTRRMHEHGAR